jgi:hypothetical protein
MKSTRLKIVFRLVGIVLLIFGCFFSIFTLELLIKPKGDVGTTLGYWPLFSLLLLASAALFIFGARRLDPKIEQKHLDEKQDHVA